MDNEIWKPIPQYEGLYEVSSYGVIKSLPKQRRGRNNSIVCHKERILVASDSHGYRSVSLTKNEVHKTFSIHRIVATAFIPNPHNYKEVNHKDENKANNNASNLEWCTTRYNLNYGTYQKRKGLSNGKPVIQYSLDGSYVRAYRSLKEAAIMNGFKSSPISNCCVGRSKTSYGFIWKY